MAPRKKVRQREAQLAFEALSIEGGLISPEWLAKVAQLGAGHQAEADYRVPKGLALRDEIGRYWRIAQAHWADFARAYAAGAATRQVAVQFASALLKDCLGFASLAPVEPVVKGERTYPLGHAALEGRVPVVVVAPRPAGDAEAARKSALDDLSQDLGDAGRRRSAFGLAQEYLNAEDDALWALATDGLTLRICRDNASLTRPAWIEADLARIFTEERYADFAALWLLAHETRFGAPGELVTACHLEAWRNAGKEEGTRAREYLRDGVEEALVALGKGFLGHPDNGPLRARLAGGDLKPDALFQELLRLVYRLIFLLTAEERELLHPDGVPQAVKDRYALGYSARRLRDRSVKRSAHDRFGDLWEGLKIGLRGAGVGEPRLGLPALGGLFGATQCPSLDAARLENRWLLRAVFKLSWLDAGAGLARVNWRDMGPEELGSVYESLLELVPVMPADYRGFGFATGAETKGNARKTTGSYYTPDSLVQVLLDSALEPVVKETVARNPADPVEAILGLTVVDPACGSGHFLLAAARRLAVHVARLQAKGTPSAAEYRHALRQVVSRCLFGVDLNPMAVELCRVSLWMEAMEPGRPLSFLDSHIQRGNALLGTTPELMAKGIPDAAFEPIEGDDKKTASLLKKRNKEVAGNQGLLDTLWAMVAADESQALAKGVAELEAAPDADLTAVAGKGAKWDAIRTSAEYRHQKFVADAWCAAFVWPKPALESAGGGKQLKPSPVAEAAPTNALWKQIQGGQGAVPEETRSTVEEIADQYHFFHWKLQFPQVFARGGFDIVLGNPPWERVNLQEREFFSARRPEIAGAPNAAERKRRIRRLESEAPDLWTEYRAACRVADSEGHFARASGRYPLCGRGDINTYSVFAESMRVALAPNGRCGVVVPSGITTDENTRFFFRSIVEGQSLVSVFGFENEELLFPGVHHSTNFCLLVMAGTKGFPEAPEFIFYARSVADLRDHSRKFRLLGSDFDVINPETKTCPVFRSGVDARIVRHVHALMPVLSATIEGAWAARFSRMYHMSDDADLFRTEEQLRESGLSVAISGDRVEGGAWLPLYEAKMIHQFDHRFGTYRGQTEAQANQGILPRFGESEHGDPARGNAPWFWVPAASVAEWKHAQSGPDWFLVWRKITRNSNSRTLISTVMPPAGVGDSLQLVLVKDVGASGLACLQANLSSMVLDYVARQKLGGTNLSHNYMGQLPVLPMAAYKSECKWLGGSVSAWVVPRSIELLCTENGMRAFAAAAGLGEYAFSWVEARRELLRAELDAAYCHLYRLDRDDAIHVLDSFAVLSRAECDLHGEYRTKRVILEIYDEMAEAIRTGKPYQTRLDPPPADPRVAHPPRHLGN